MGKKVDEQLIPKIIHYCWFGGNPLPDIAIKCMNSWRKYCPDYEIKEWNETNFDLDWCPYVREAYEEKKWAFVSDVVRLYALVTVGGIYMDTDVEVIKPLDSLLKYDAVSGFETMTQIPTGLMASRPNQELFIDLLHEYDHIHFRKADGSLDKTTNVIRITKQCLKYGLQLNNTLQTIRGLTLLPHDYLCPKNYMTGKLEITENTYCIHYFSGTWLSEEDLYSVKLRYVLEKYVPNWLAGRFGKFVAVVKFRGLKVACQEIIRWLKGSCLKDGR